jgi:hypothetical protein
MNALWLALLLWLPPQPVHQPASIAAITKATPGFTVPAFPDAPPPLYTYGEIREPNGIDRYYAIGVRWDWSWEEVETGQASILWVWAGTTDVHQVDAEPATVILPKIVGTATVYYGGRAWKRRVILEPME